MIELKDSFNGASAAVTDIHNVFPEHQYNITSYYDAAVPDL